MEPTTTGRLTNVEFLTPTQEEICEMKEPLFQWSRVSSSDATLIG